jgi:hypothetical protein
MSLMSHPTVAGDAKTAHQATLMPMLRTARRVKRSLVPVQPSLAFQASLEGELMGMARRLAMSRGNGSRTVVRVAKSAEIRTQQMAAVVGGLASVSILVALVLLMRTAGRQRDRG